MSRNAIETVVGALVLITAAGFVAFALRSGEVDMKTDSYKVAAKFTDATGINVGSAIRLGGIKIGTVTGLSLDPETYEAVADFQLYQTTKVPVDSSAAIVSSGLLGEKFVSITPGADDAMLKTGSVIKYTQSSVNLEQLIGKVVFSGGGVDGKDKDKEKSGDTKS